MPRARPRHRAPKPPRGAPNVLQAVAVLGAGLTGVAVLTVVAGGPASVGVVAPDGSLVTSRTEPSARLGSGAPTPVSTGGGPVATGIPSQPPGLGPVVTTPAGTTPGATTPADTTPAGTTPTGIPAGGPGTSTSEPTSPPVTTTPEPTPTVTRTHPAKPGKPTGPPPRPTPSPTG